MTRMGLPTPASHCRCSRTLAPRTGQWEPSQPPWRPRLWRVHGSQCACGHARDAQPPVQAGGMSWECPNLKGPRPTGSRAPTTTTPETGDPAKAPNSPATPYQHHFAAATLAGAWLIQPSDTRWGGHANACWGALACGPRFKAQTEPNTQHPNCHCNCLAFTTPFTQLPATPPTSTTAMTSGITSPTCFSAWACQSW